MMVHWQEENRVKDDDSFLMAVVFFCVYKMGVHVLKGGH